MKLLNSENTLDVLPKFPGLIRVLVVDDSALMRRMLEEIFSSDDRLEVVATAKDAFDARDKIKQFNPDVITLDVEMPGMDGIQFLKNLMRLRPMPVVMVSSVTSKGSSVTLDALEIGAVDFVHKPAAGNDNVYHDYAREVISKVVSAKDANVQTYKPELNNVQAVTLPEESTDGLPSYSAGSLIVIGSSTGGTEALKKLLVGFPRNSPPIVIAQHIPSAFSKSFADRLDVICRVKVQQAQDRQSILPGNVYVAPGDKHLAVKKVGGKLICHLDDGPPVNCHKPSVDTLFASVKEAVGRRALGIILTGMGDDGAREMKGLHDEGAYTIAQDEASSVVWGMPGKAVQRGAVDAVLPLTEIAEKALNRVSMR